MASFKIVGVVIDVITRSRKNFGYDAVGFSFGKMKVVKI